MFEEGEKVLLQSLKTKKWDTEGIVKKRENSRRRYNLALKNQRREPEPQPGLAHSSKTGYRKGSVAQEISNKGAIFLIIYPVICTISFGIMIYFLTLNIRMTSG